MAVRQRNRKKKGGRKGTETKIGSGKGGKRREEGLEDAERRSRKERIRQKARGVVEAKKEKAKELKEKDRSCSRQRDIVQIAESGDIDHRGAAAAEPPGTDTSDLTVPLQPLLPSPSVAASVSRLHRLPTRPAGNRITR